MRMLIVVAVTLGFVLSASFCRARLGDTMDQCVDRWGTGKHSDIPPDAHGVSNTTFKSFSKDGFLLVAGFTNGIVSYERISKAEAKLSSGEVEDILNAETAGLKWTKDSSAPSVWHCESWHRADGAYAFYEKENGNISLTSKEFQEAWMAAQTHRPF